MQHIAVQAIFLFTLGQCIGEWLFHNLKSCSPNLLGSVISYENVDYYEVGSGKNWKLIFLQTFCHQGAGLQKTLDISSASHLVTKKVYCPVLYSLKNMCNFPWFHTSLLFAEYGFLFWTGKYCTFSRMNQNQFQAKNFYQPWLLQKGFYLPKKKID